jgi:hypothetical protein
MIDNIVNHKKIGVTINRYDFIVRFSCTLKMLNLINFKQIMVSKW